MWKTEWTLTVYDLQQMVIHVYIICTHWWTFDKFGKAQRIPPPKMTTFYNTRNLPQDATLMNNIFAILYRKNQETIWIYIFKIYISKEIWE